MLEDVWEPFVPNSMEREVSKVKSLSQILKEFSKSDILEMSLKGFSLTLYLEKHLYLNSVSEIQILFLWSDMKSTSFNKTSIISN